MIVRRLRLAAALFAVAIALTALGTSPADAWATRRRGASDRSASASPAFLESASSAIAQAQRSGGGGGGGGGSSALRRSGSGRSAVGFSGSFSPSKAARAVFRDGVNSDYSEHSQSVMGVLDQFAGANDFDSDFGSPRDTARFASVSEALASFGGAGAGGGQRQRQRQRQRLGTKPEGGNDKIECYNNHNLYAVGMLTSTAELCSLMVENLADAFEDSPSFQSECTETFGEVCKEECRDLGHLFDQSVYAEKGGTDSYPNAFHNQIRNYELKYWDCKNCLELGSCYAGTQNLLVDD